MPNFLTAYLKSYWQVSTNNLYDLTVHFQIVLIFIYVIFFRIAVWDYMSFSGGWWEGAILTLLCI